MKNLLICFIFLFSCTSNETETVSNSPLQIKDPYNLSNNKTYIVVDYKIPSFKNRFFVIHEGNIIFQSLVCSGKEGSEVIFSNVPESHCSSKGRIEILYSYNGNFGKAYKIKGLDKTNSNIFKRNIVLHSHGCVPYEETSYRICNSQGCLTLNPNKFTELDSLINLYKIKLIIII